jgi:hypothetical protein
VCLAELLAFAGGVGPDQVGLAVGQCPDAFQFGGRGFGGLPGAGSFLFGGAGTDVGLCGLVLRGGDRAVPVSFSRFRGLGRGLLGLGELGFGGVAGGLRSLLGASPGLSASDRAANWRSLSRSPILLRRVDQTQGPPSWSLLG